MEADIYLKLLRVVLVAKAMTMIITTTFLDQGVLKYDTLLFLLNEKGTQFVGKFSLGFGSFWMKWSEEKPYYPRSMGRLSGTAIQSWPYSQFKWLCISQTETCTEGFCPTCEAHPGL